MEAVGSDLVDKSLKNSRIFGDLGESLLKDIRDKVTVEMVKGGDFVYRQGEPSDSMIVLVSGRLLAKFTEDDGSSKILADISPGSSVGELGLILQQSRSASVIAIRDSFIATLTRSCFESLLKNHPVEINRAITRTVFEYNTLLNKKSRIVSATILTFISVADNNGTEQLCQTLLTDISQSASVKYICPEEGQALTANATSHDQVSMMINELEQRYEYLIFRIENDASEWSELAARQSDQITVVADANTPPERIVIDPALCSGNMFFRIRKSLVLLHEPHCLQPRVQPNWANVLPFDNIYPIRIAHNADTQRLKRFLTDSAVALVLGGGGARGLAHVGVIRALEEQGIPIDYVCGNSMGALIGAQYVYGTSVTDLVQSTQKFIKGGERITVPFFSLLSGNRIKTDLQRMFAGAQVEALWRPFFTVSCNISRAEIFVHETGALWEAVLASNSPAGILPPVIKDGNLLVDAALLDNVPVEPMRQRFRYGTLIAVDVDVTNELAVDNDMTHFSKRQHVMQLLNKDKSTQQPGIFELLNRSGHLGGLARRKIAREMADYYLQPPVSEFGLMAYGRGEEIANTAYHYTKTHLQTWAHLSVLQSSSQKSSSDQ